MRYRVFFTGKVNDEIENHEIIQNLIALYELEEADVIRQFFLGHSKDLLSDLSLDDAKEYAEAVKDAGLIIEIKPMIEDESAPIDKIQPQAQKPKKDSDSTFETLSALLKEEEVKDFPTTKSSISKPNQKPAKKLELNQKVEELSAFLMEEEESYNQKNQHQKENQQIQEKQRKEKFSTITLLQDYDEKSEVSKSRQRVRKEKKKEREVKVKYTEKISGPSIGYILSPEVRSNRTQFILRILSVLVLAYLTLKTLNIIFLQIANSAGLHGNFPITATIFFLIVLAIFGMVFITQRLHDLGRTAAHLIIFIIPIILVILAQFTQKIDQIKFDELSERRDLVESYARISNPTAEIDAELARLQESLAKETIDYQSFYNDYRYFFYFAYVTNALLLLYLVVTPGHKGMNVYGIPQPFELGTQSTVIISVIILALLISVLSPFMIDDYKDKKAEFDRLLFDTIGLTKS